MMKKLRADQGTPVTPPADVPPPSSPEKDAPEQPKVEHRLDRLVAVAVVTTYVNGQPVTEQRTQPLNLFRASAPNVWAVLEQVIKDGPRQDRSQ